MSNAAIDSDDADCDDRPDCTCLESDDDCPVHPSAAFWTVAIFMVDRAYGGPEEGGWWYTYGTPIDHIPDGVNPHDLITVFAADSKKEAHAWRDTLQASLDAGPNKGRRDIGSVLSEGQYAAELQAGWPRAYPDVIPHYE
jgi:hypothetical protein